nr:MAG TPA: hypothetical protein [Caudoviricetes sp.]
MVVNVSQDSQFHCLFLICCCVIGDGIVDSHCTVAMRSINHDIRFRRNHFDDSIQKARNFKAEQCIFYVQSQFVNQLIQIRAVCQNPLNGNVQLPFVGEKPVAVILVFQNLFVSGVNQKRRQMLVEQWFDPAVVNMVFGQSIGFFQFLDNGFTDNTTGMRRIAHGGQLSLFRECDILRL